MSLFKKTNLDRIRLISEILLLILFIILLKNKVLQKWVFIFVGSAVLSIIFGRFYCGWLCPMGTLLRFQTWLYRKMGIKRLKPLAILKRQGFRWLWLILFVGMMVIVKKTGLQLNILLYLALASVVLSAFFREEFWHRYICPYGTILSTINKKSIYKMQIESTKCTGCGVCETECPDNSITSGNEGKRKIDSHECLVCLKCQESCPVDAVGYSK